jgi:zinc/manganese transport system substrate-binding protein
VLASSSLLLVAACSSTTGSDGATATTGDGPPCPVDPVTVVVTVNQWGDLVGQLGGRCVEVTTIIDGGNADPHDFEPTPADNAAFSNADLVVVNGLGYDHWASEVVDTLSPEPAVVDGGEVVGRHDGDNPHLWYGPGYVQQIADAITGQLEALAPDASPYFEERAAAWAGELQPYLDEIAALRAGWSGATYVATEPVFEYMATAIGLTDLTPAGYRSAAANESDPAPGDINAFEEALRSGSVDVLIDNTQTQGSLPDQLRRTAEAAGVPVVEVTESVPPGASSFVAWQLAQLQSLSSALGR